MKAPKYLVIVESPTKEKTISKMLGSDYMVLSSYGHIRDLPSSKLGVDIEDNFKPSYIIMPKAKKLLPDLKEGAKKTKLVYLATDYDREGEAIAWHLQKALDLPDTKIKRITFHEITQSAIKEALENPRKIDLNLVDSQQARRVLDRLVGYKLSPLLWKKIKYGLSAGRVQSVAVHLICEREKEIAKFNSLEYWSVHAELEKEKEDKSHFISNLFSKGTVRYEKLDVKNKEAVDVILKDLENAQYVVSKVERKEQRRSPLPPYITSSMQQDASRRINFSAAKTMMMAQKLYEGMPIGDEGNVGLITYMRTDSFNVAVQAQKEAKKYVEEKYGKNFLPEKQRIYQTKSKSAQEAHEAIRPTSVYRAPNDIKKYLSGDEFKLYELIWQRFVSSQMTDAVYDTLSCDIKAKNYIFRATGKTLKFSGFLQVYEILENDNGKEKDDKDSSLPDLIEGEKLSLIKLYPEQHFTEPPPRFNEASLIKALEEHGIGRPSTYAPIIKTIQDRSYVRMDQRRFFPTQLGSLVDSVLAKHFAEIVDIEFTAGVEEKLDLIAEGSSKWTKVIEEFYTPFSKDLEQADKNMERQKIKPEESKEICPKCGKPMVIRDSRRGRFLACSGFPECRTTFSIDKNNDIIVKPAPEATGQVCEKCGKPMLKRFGKRGPFLACSGFPGCRNTKRLPKEDGNKEQDEK
ncbi:MAG: type I DNA topoisomerase [Elusimicrobia bacterium]|nr:type I DNA topoisomerase [Candidatus Liberimonas magnetica]